MQGIEGDERRGEGIEVQTRNDMRNNETVTGSALPWRFVSVSFMESTSSPSSVFLDVKFEQPFWQRLK